MNVNPHCDLPERLQRAPWLWSIHNFAFIETWLTVVGWRRGRRVLYVTV